MQRKGRISITAAHQHPPVPTVPTKCTQPGELSAEVGWAGLAEVGWAPFTALQTVSKPGRRGSDHQTQDSERVTVESPALRNSETQKQGTGTLPGVWNDIRSTADRAEATLV